MVGRWQRLQWSAWASGTRGEHEHLRILSHSGNVHAWDAFTRASAARVRGAHCQNGLEGAWFGLVRPVVTLD
jgi:hypothetical protein